MVIEHHKGVLTHGKRGFAMRRKHTRAIRGAAVLAAALAAAGLTAAAAGTAATGTAAAAGTRNIAARASTALTAADAQGRMHPDLVRVGISPEDVPLTDGQCQAVVSIDCYLPTQVEAAYNLPALYNKGVTGKGTTIVIVDAYGSPSITSDLAQFDDYIGLGVPPFQIVKYGNVPTYDDSNGDMLSWAQETTLDVEYAHAGAPGAKIVLVEAPNDSDSGLFGAVNYAITHHLGNIISMSWGGAEPNDGRAADHSFDKLFAAAEKAHITVVNSSGDDGVSDINNNGNYYNHPVVNYPASNPLVTAVGGTEININASGQRGGSDSGWNDTYNKPAQNFYFGSDGPNPLATGGGKSVFYSRPSWQNSVKSVTGSARGVPDISMSASCAAAVGVYWTFNGVNGGWYIFCGTSEAAPMFAAVVALADQEAGHALGFINPALYKLAAEHAPGIVAISGGNNTVSFGNTTVHGYTVKHGYNLVTGLGSINGQYFVPELAKLG
jgi:subtilase family serine protease